ncbi:MAG: GNAT family N-acetyltransferase [Planctomycetaceae bacterium]|jgi:GNAT superfamily N-acetyltransferase|nr:GNAT family N-acetyltransferase [Planctomycetaceae bacterium]
MTVEISNPSSQELEETLRFAFGHLPENELTIRTNSMLEQYHLGTLSLEGIFQAKIQDQRIGAFFSQLRIDQTVLSWVPIMKDGFSIELFFEPFMAFCCKNQVIAVLALVDLGQQFDETTLVSAGKFELLSDLIYLVLPVTATTEDSDFTGELEFFPMSYFSEDVFEPMAELVHATYRNTRDFPQLMQIAPVKQVLQMYQSGQIFLPELWFFVRKENQNIGVLLMTDQPEEQIELTYMGLIEEARGHGYSREIVRYAKRIAGLRKRLFLLTSVDEQNINALKTYLSQGFRVWDRKNIYVKFLKQECNDNDKM